MATHTANGDPGGRERTVELPEHVVDSVLASAARRRLLRRLRDAGEPMPVGDLAAAVAASATDGVRPDAAGDDVPTDRQRARADIYQHHLPRLLETRIVAFDSRLGTVEYTGGPRVTERLDEES